MSAALDLPVSLPDGALHLWRGQWLDDAALDASLPELAAALAEDLGVAPPLSALLQAIQSLGNTLGQQGPLYQSLFDLLMQAPEARPDDAHATLQAVSAFLHRESLETKLKRELGGTDPFTPRRIDYQDHRFEAWAPLGVLVHVAPGNVSSVAPLSVIEGLLSGNINILKTSSDATRFPQALLAALLAHDRSGQLAAYIYVAQVSSRDTTRLAQLFAMADGIAAWGGEAAVAAVRGMAPAGCRVVEWGHKISFACLARETLQDETVLQAVARDICTIEQQACSSPQSLYVEVDDRQALFDFAQRFAHTLSQVSEAMPRKAPDAQEQAEITTITQLARLESVYSGNTRVFEAEDGSWRILAEDNPALRTSPLYRSIWIKPLDPTRLTATLRPMRPWLQTAGLACDMQRYAELSARLLAAGVSRITRVGEQLGGYTGAPHDGVYALQRYCRRISCELPPQAQGVSSFHELREPQPPHLEGVPILDKTGFLQLETQPQHAHLFFKSGGSSGQPKMAVYSWEDYRSQMRAAADGLYAAGLEPAHDRVMNLFFAGHLYGSFISFWSILEHLGAAQFPMTGIDDLEEVANTIVQYKVDTLLGMPFYFTKLFTEQADKLKAYGGIKKLFYGGEHFSRPLRDQLQREFGIELIRAAAYGSNDAGPLGYQTPYCADGEYHVLTQTQHLEIVDPETDKPAEPGQPGRLIFTSLARQGQSVQRYEIGDMGRWLPGDAACGRKAPRFELLGRHGDLFRAPYFFNYGTFKRILSEHGGYDGPLQLQLSQEGDQHHILVRIQDNAVLPAASVPALLLAHYHDLREFVEGMKTTALAAETVMLDGFATTANTGKLKAIVDLRSPA